jgi:hypothetical protein
MVRFRRNAVVRWRALNHPVERLGNRRHAFGTEREISGWTD